MHILVQIVDHWLNNVCFLLSLGVSLPQLIASVLAMKPHSQCVVCVNRFTALRPAQLPSPLFITNHKRSPTQHSLPKLLPHRRLNQSAPRPLEMHGFPGRTEAISRTPSRSDQASSTHRRAAPVITVCSLRVCMSVTVCVCSSASGSGGLQRLTGQRDTRGKRQKKLQRQLPRSFSK